MSAELRELRNGYDMKPEIGTRAATTSKHLIGDHILLKSDDENKG